MSVGGKFIEPGKVVGAEFVRGLAEKSTELVLRGVVAGSGGFFRSRNLLRLDDILASESRSPNCRREAGVGRAPAGGAREVVDSGRRISKRRGNGCRCLAGEINADQGAAGLECGFFDGDDAVGDSDTR